MSPEARCAAEWWVAKLRAAAPGQDVALALFGGRLAEWLDEEMTRRQGAPIPLTTSDCGPQLHIGDIASVAGLKIGSMLWPNQAGMFVSPGCVYVHEGYNSLRQTLLP